MRVGMRIAFIDLQFSWPPKGGGEVDLFNTVKGIQGLGHEVKLFARSHHGSWERGGSVESAVAPFPIEVVPGIESGSPTVAAKRIRAAVDAWKPNAVMLVFGFFLGPYLAEALGHYRLALRFFAYECVCPRDFRLFWNGAPCPKNYIETPDICRRCMVRSRGGEIASARPMPYIREYLDTAAYTPGYYRRTLEALRKARVIVVYNPIMAAQFEGVGPEIVEIPGGVDPAAFAPPAERARRSHTVILMPGRAEDPTKGFATLADAARELAAERDDFEIWVTQAEAPADAPPQVRAAGWRDPASFWRTYQEADVAVVPSIWEEPFGLVAVEAMASGLPVVASQVGGLQRIVRDGETGILVPPADSRALAHALRRLIADPAERQRMGTAGRALAEEEYGWDRVVRKHYAPVFDKLAEAREAAP